MEKISDINYIAMNDNVLDISIYNIKKSDDYSDMFLPTENLFIKIDVRGNVTIQKQNIYRNWILPECCVPHRRGKLIDVLVIKDDIEIPDYVISFIKTLLIPNQTFYMNYYNKIVESIKSLKHTLRLEFSDTYYNDCFSEIV
jgi:hypothetical protein